MANIVSGRTNLSVNLNKIALLRNSRGGNAPDVLAAAQTVIDLGADGITVHPREDERHITPDDVMALARLEDVRAGRMEYNIEGDMRPQLVSLVETVKPTQYTVVPVCPGEITSQRGWREQDDHKGLQAIAARMKSRVRIAVFCDPDPASVDLAARADIDAVEFHTGTYASQPPASPQADAAIADIARAAEHARALGLRVHGGHDLTLENLPPLLQRVRFDELSIGHHIAATALLRGFESSVRDYLECVKQERQR